MTLDVSDVGIPQELGPSKQTEDAHQPMSNLDELSGIPTLISLLH